MVVRLSEIMAENQNEPAPPPPQPIPQLAPLNEQHVPETGATNQLYSSSPIVIHKKTPPAALPPVTANDETNAVQHRLR